MTVNSDIYAAIEHVEKFLDQQDWRARLAAYREAMLEPIFRELDIEIPELFKSLEDLGLLSSFAAYADEAFFCADPEPHGTNAIEAYLKRRGWQETPRARAYLAGMRRSTPSVWEVRSTEPGAWVEVVDRFGDGTIVRVSEQSASRTLSRYDRVVARVLAVREVHMFTGGMLALAHAVGDDLEGKLRRLAKAGKATREVVTATCLQFWTVAVLRAVSQPLPELQTTHGEALVLGQTRLTFAPAASSHEITGILDAAAAHGWTAMPSDDTHGWVWFDPIAPDTILANLQIEGSDVLVLETLSRRRMERALESLKALLGDRVRVSLTSFEDPVQAIRKSRRNPGRRRPTESPVQDGQSGGDLELPPEAVRQYLDDHYRRTLDDRIPMLGGKTPRECARSKPGRRKLVAWLKYLENAELHRARDTRERPYDYGWLWRELGVEDQR